MPFEISLWNVLRSLFSRVFQVFTQTKGFLDKNFKGGFLVIYPRYVNSKGIG